MMMSYKDLDKEFETLCDEYAVSPPVGPSQELTKADRVGNVQGMLNVAKEQFPNNDTTEEFIENCEAFLSVQ